MKSCLVVVFLLGLTSTIRADPGPAEEHFAIAEYIQATGEVIVSGNVIESWYIESASASLTGAEPVGIPSGPTLVTNSNRRIGEAALLGWSFVNINLGPVAARNLPCSDLRIFFFYGARPVLNAPVICTVPEPGITMVVAFGMLGLVTRYRRSAVASIDQISRRNVEDKSIPGSCTVP